VKKSNGTKDIIIDRKSILNFGDLKKTIDPLETITQPVHDDTFVTIKPQK